MSQVREQKQHIEDIATARFITGTLRDIATIELAKLQERFVLNTTVYSELRDLYQIVWRIGRQTGAVTGKKTGQRNVLYVAYTTNKHFYGTLNHTIMRRFTDATGTKDDCLIIGATGKDLWLANAKKRKRISYLQFADDIPTGDEVRGFLERVAGYDQVFVCYPKFVSVFQQDADIVDITFLPSETQDESVDPAYGPQFLLEPNVVEMLAFFSTQVRYALFDRILLETQLSQVSARLVKMDTADQNAEQLLHREGQLLRRAYTTIAGRRMLETLVGYIQWHKNAQFTAR